MIGSRITDQPAGHNLLIVSIMLIDLIDDEPVQMFDMMKMEGSGQVRIET
jgi:hypothetical protein